MRQFKWLTLAALLGAAQFTTVSCSCEDPDAVPDAGEDAGVEEEDAGFDAGIEDAGVTLTCIVDEECVTPLGTDFVCDLVESVDNPTYNTCIERCRFDEECERYNLGLRCEERTGHCIPARGCDPAEGDSNCPPSQFDPEDYCSTTGLGCRCVTETNATGLSGVCRRRLPVCGECTHDEQCGTGPLFDPIGRCRALQGDPNGGLPDGGTRKYCFQASAVCGCGMQQGPEGGLCIPQSANCSQVGCTTNDDCSFGNVCDTSRCLCVPRCVWNFDRQELNSPGCPTATPACWVDPENLDPKSAFFGTGRCMPECTDDAQCQAIDARLVCRGEKIAGGTSPKRCRPGGDCMDNLECEPPQQGSVYLGYCDRASFECKTDCRTGVDPVSGSFYEDCISGYKCEDQNGTNVCKQMTCLEQGGGRQGCQWGQFCCGEDRNGDGTTEPCPTSGVEPNQCYKAPSPPFCTTCQSHEECNQPGYNVNGSVFQSLCFAGGPNPTGGAEVNVCAVATFNDFTVDPLSGTPAAFRGCPRGYVPEVIKIECTSNAQCDPAGAPGTGVCDGDPQQMFPDGGRPLVCLCVGTGTGTDSSQCPGDPDAGTATYCRYAPQGAVTQCLSSVVCNPNPGLVYQPIAEGGCGL